MRRQIVGPDAAPLLVIGPRPLRRALQAYSATEPLLFTYLDNAHTMVRGKDPPPLPPPPPPANDEEGVRQPCSNAFQEMVFCSISINNHMTIDFSPVYPSSGGRFPIKSRCGRMSAMVLDPSGRGRRAVQEGAEVPEAAAPHLAAAKRQLGLSRLQSVRVDHCAHAYGVALTGSPAGGHADGARSEQPLNTPTHPRGSPLLPLAPDTHTHTHTHSATNARVHASLHAQAAKARQPGPGIADGDPPHMGTLRLAR